MEVACPDCREFIKGDVRCKTCGRVWCEKCGIEHVCTVELVNRALERIEREASRNGWLPGCTSNPDVAHDLEVTWTCERDHSKHACTLTVREITIVKQRRFSVILDGEISNADPARADFRVFSVPFEPLISGKQVVFASPPIDGRVFNLQ